MKNLSSRKYFPISTQRNPLASFKNELNKVMQDFYNWNWLEPFNFSGEKFENLIISPPVDILDDDDHFKVEIEVPGMKEEDMRVSVTDNLLTIKGEKTTSTEDKDKNYVMREISYGNYERRIPLPESVDIDKAKASFKKGMLWVDIPKKPENVRKPRVLEIERA